MYETLSKESHTLDRDEQSTDQIGSLLPAFVEPYIKLAEPYWLTARKYGQVYGAAAKEAVRVLWQYPDVRLVLYILAALSALPVSIFVLYAATTLFVSTCITSLLWIFLVAVGLTLGILILAPFILGAAFISVGAVVAYELYTYWRPTEPVED
ncbi:hypothetical protein BJV82DRAFT_635006 [Fennellomyces sp. T-0311]|nr:hypothetical protein BJV82DRAFT_635006 [Fennellomyces sp. T-0311]